MNLDYVISVTTLPIFVLGLLGNTLSIAVWSTQLHTVGGAKFLLALSVSDSLAIIGGIVRDVLYLVDSRSICVANLFLYIEDMFYSLSSYITIAIVIQRYLSIARPFSVRTVCSGPRQVVTIALLVVLTIVQNIPYGNLTAVVYRYCTGEDTDFELYVASFRKMMYALTAMNFVAPCLLTVFNLLLIHKLLHMDRVNYADSPTRDFKQI